jgi:hypothetical protein
MQTAETGFQGHTIDLLASWFRFCVSYIFRGSAVVELPRLRVFWEAGQLRESNCVETYFLCHLLCSMTVLWAAETMPLGMVLFCVCAVALPLGHASAFIAKSTTSRSLSQAALYIVRGGIRHHVFQFLAAVRLLSWQILG